MSDKLLEIRAGHAQCEADLCDKAFLLELLDEARADLIHEVNKRPPEDVLSRSIIPAGQVTSTRDLPELYAAYLNHFGVVDGVAVVRSIAGIARAGTAVVATVCDRILNNEAGHPGKWRDL